MGLNDDVDEGLPPEDEPNPFTETDEESTVKVDPPKISDLPDNNAEDDQDESFVTPPDTNVNQAPAPATVLVAGKVPDAKPVTAEDLFGDNIVKNELPNLNAEFVILDKDIDHTYEMSEVKNRLEQDSSIAQEDAVEINELVPGFINDRNPLIYYSRGKSKSRLKFSLESLDVAIDLQYDKLKKSIVNMSNVLNASIAAYSKALQERFAKISTELNESLTSTISDSYLSIFDLDYTFPDKSTAHQLLFDEIKCFFPYEVEQEVFHCNKEINDILSNLKCKSVDDFLNFRYYLNSNDIEKVLIWVNDDIYQFTKTDYKKDDNEYRLGYCRLGTVISQFGGVNGIEIVTKLFNAISVLAGTHGNISKQLEEIDAQQDIPLVRKCDAISIVGGELKTTYGLLIAIQNVIENIFNSLKAVIEIIKIILKLSKETIQNQTTLVTQ